LVEGSRLPWLLGRSLVFGVFGVFGAFVACDVPRDPERSLERALERGALRAGFSGEDGEDAEARATIEAFARSLGLSVQWTREPLGEALADLTENRLDVVVGCIRSSTTWKGRVALTREWTGNGGTPEVFAVAPGENRLL